MERARVRIGMRLRPFAASSVRRTTVGRSYPRPSPTEKRIYWPIVPTTFTLVLGNLSPLKLILKLANVLRLVGSLSVAVNERKIRRPPAIYKGELPSAKIGGEPGSETRPSLNKR